MKRRSNLIQLLLVFGCLLLAASGAEFRQLQDDHILARLSFEEERWLNQGVKHRCIFVPEKPWLINILEIELPQQHLGIEVEKGKDYLFGGERVGEIAERESSPGHQVVAAINGDFWGRNHMPIGLFVDDGVIFKNPHPTRSVFLMDASGHPHITSVSMKTTLRVAANKEELEIGSINPENPEREEVNLFTWVYGVDTARATEAVEILLQLVSKEFIPNKPCDLKVVKVGEAGERLTLEQGRVIVSLRGKARPWVSKFKPGEQVTLLATIEEVKEPVVLAIGGLPRLIREGKISIEYQKEQIRESFVTTRHPRTAIGFTRDRKRLILLTVDGRQPQISIGMDLNEVAEQLQQLGCWEAMNLDGGGSTTMWTWDEIVNRPSDRTGPRVVSNALLVISKTRPGAAQHISVFPEGVMLPLGGELDFSLQARDQWLNPVELEEKEAEWSVAGEIGRIREGGQFAAVSHPACGSVHVRWKDKMASATVEVVKPERIEVVPERLVLKRGESRTLRVNAFAGAGKRIYLARIEGGISPAEVAGWDGDERTVQAESAGKGVLTLNIGGVRKEVPVYVDWLRKVVVHSFDWIPEDLALTGKQYVKEETRVRLEKEKVKQGDAAWRWDYDMVPGGTTAIYLPLDLLIPDEPEGIALWVYGDGKEQWLRGELQDADGELFLLDFTEGGKGIHWEGWRWLEVSKDTIIPKWNNPGAIVNYPVRLRHIYLVQAQQKMKSSGSIVVDGLTGVYLKP